MAKMIQIRNVPEALHRQLKVRAASEGKTLSDYLLAELRRLTSYPTPAELRARLEARGPIEVATPPAEIIRAMRDGR